MIIKNHSTQDSHVVPHHGTNWAALWLTVQIRRDAVLSESYGRGYCYCSALTYIPMFMSHYRLVVIEIPPAAGCLGKRQKGKNKHGGD